MAQGTGQRVQLLVFSGNVKANTRWTINTSAGSAAVLTKANKLELSGDSTADFLGPRDTSSTSKNGHFTVTADS